MDKKYKVINEKAFASQVEDLLKIFGWRYSHFRPAWTEKGWRTPLSGDKGFPDYVAVRQGKLFFIELKSESGKITPSQQEWLDALYELVDDSGMIKVYIWRPSQIEEIADILQ